MWASRKSMTDFGRSTSGPSGWVGSTKPRAASWITSAEQLAEKVGITRESVTNQLITKCHLSSELFITTSLEASHASSANGAPPASAQVHRAPQTHRRARRTG